MVDLIIAFGFGAFIGSLVGVVTVALVTAGEDYED
jgi:hypothetical protein